MPTHSPGTIAIISGFLSRYADFWASAMATLAPVGSNINLVRGIHSLQNCNRAIREMRGEWIWMMDDDHVYAPDTLLKLLEVDAPLVVPLVARRSMPFRTLVGDRAQASGNGIHRMWSWYEVPTDGKPFEVGGASRAGMLIRRPVIEALSDPWFEPHPVTQGGNDYWFCEKAADAGFHIMVQPEATMGHLTTVMVQPVLGAGGWLPRLQDDCGVEICAVGEAPEEVQ